MADPARDIRTRILAQVADAASVTYAGPWRPEPAGKAVFCLTTGGPPPDDFIGSAESDRKVQVQVRVRHEPDEFRDGELLARACFNACHYAEISGYLDVRVLEAHPLYLGRDDDKRHEWSFTVQLRYTETTI